MTEIAVSGRSLAPAGRKGLRIAAALIFLACTTLPAVLVLVLATRAVVAEEQAFRAFVHQWGPHLIVSQIVGARLIHLHDLLPLYLIVAASAGLEAASASAIRQGRRGVVNVALPLATLLAGASIVALSMAGNPIDSCFHYEDFGGCGADSAEAQNMLATAHLLAIAGALVCLFTLVMRLPRAPDG
jgi:hypothetical protein